MTGSYFSWLWIWTRAKKKKNWNMIKDKLFELVWYIITIFIQLNSEYKLVQIPLHISYCVFENLKYMLGCFWWDRLCSVILSGIFCIRWYLVVYGCIWFLTTNTHWLHPFSWFQACFFKCCNWGHKIIYWEISNFVSDSVKSSLSFLHSFASTSLQTDDFFPSVSSPVVVFSIFSD